MHKIKPNKTEHKVMVSFKTGLFCCDENLKPRTAGIAYNNAPIKPPIIGRIEQSVTLLLHTAKTTRPSI